MVQRCACIFRAPRRSEPRYTSRTPRSHASAAGRATLYSASSPRMRVPRLRPEVCPSIRKASWHASPARCMARLTNPFDCDSELATLRRTEPWPEKICKCLYLFSSCDLEDVDRSSTISRPTIWSVDLPEADCSTEPAECFTSAWVTLGERSATSSMPTDNEFVAGTFSVPQACSPRKTFFAIAATH